MAEVMLYPWFIFILFLIGVLVYLIASGGKMNEHRVRDAKVRERELRSYVQEAAGSQSSADQLAKLADLRDRGVITAEEFDREKAKILAERDRRPLALALKRPWCPAAVRQAREAADAEPVDREYLGRVRLAGQRVVVEVGPGGGDEQRVPAGPGERARGRSLDRELHPGQE